MKTEILGYITVSCLQQWPATDAEAENRMSQCDASPEYSLLLQQL